MKGNDRISLKSISKAVDRGEVKDNKAVRDIGREAGKNRRLECLNLQCI